MAYKYYTKRASSSNCFIFECDPDEFRVDATIGTAKRLERLSKINGEPKDNEYTIAKINGGFFAMNGSTEYLGTFVDDGKYYSGALPYYPTLIMWKDNHMSIELEPDQSRCAYYQGNAQWAIGVPWTLVVNGKIDYTYEKSFLQKIFQHPAYRNPRTMIGQKTDGTVVLVVVDGRKTTSLGMTIDQQAKLMLDLGCTIAVNLDGGGSSEMIVNDKIVNKLSDGCERAIGTAFCVYAKRATTVDTTYSATGTVTATSLNVRSGPGTNYGRVGLLYKNDSVKIVSTSGGSWYKIVFGSGYGYVSSAYIKVNSGTSSSTPASPEYATGVTTTALNMRKGASTKYAKILTIPKGKTVKLLASTNGWYKVDYNGTTGFCSGAYIKVS